jgi:hypothetical protein
VKADGHEYCYLEIKHAAGRLELWFDPSVNYLVKKAVVHIDSPPGSKIKRQRFEGVASSFREVAKGMFFPERVSVENFDDNQSTRRLEREFIGVKFNEPIPADIFEVHYPPGSEVIDKISGRVKRADENGGLVAIPGPEGEVARGRPLERADSVGSDSVQRQTEAEPVRTSRLILPISICILLVVVLLSIVRLVRQRGGAPS